MFGDRELAAALGRPRIRAALAEIRANPMVGHGACPSMDNIGLLECFAGQVQTPYTDV
jgi:hypothetical protein